ncbi:MAG: 3-deoxy-D-manno-octulosonic acid transferase [Aquabacterium sp.]
MTALLARVLYATLWRLGLPLYFARLWWRGRREPGYRRHWAERLGYGRPTPPGALWLHAVSLGETRAAAPLLAALRRDLPGLRVLLTHGTATGREAGRALLRDGDHARWLPVDTPGACARFLERHQPGLLVLMETEVWPALLHAADRAGLPVVLANARLSARSAGRAGRTGWLMRPAAGRITLALAQTVDDAQRLREAGLPRVEVCGNLKFDITPHPKLLARGLQWRQALARPVVLAAITRDGEEALLLQAWRDLPEPRPLLQIVPRHPQRFDAVAGIVAAAGFALARRSSWTDLPPAQALQAHVWLGDSLGEMPLYYACADVALLGGSFAPLGGHNLIEAAACGCPLIMGPSTFNFADAAEQALAAGAAERVPDMAAAVRRAVAVADDLGRNDWVQRAFNFAAAHRGAADRMAGRIGAVARTAG